MKIRRQFRLIVVATCITEIGISLAIAQPKSEIAKRLSSRDMNRIIADSVKKAYTNSRDIDAAMQALNAASEAIDTGNTAAAKQMLEEAKQFMQTVQKSTKQYLEKAPVANAKCPITGLAITRTDVPADRTSMYKGRKIGFCSAACPAEWGKLSNAEKSDKLKLARPKKRRKKTSEHPEHPAPIREKSKKEHPGY